LQELAERVVNGRTFALGAIGGVGVSVQLALAGRAVASTAQRPRRRLNRGSACVRGSQTMPMSFGWIWGQEE
jgi:predicted molibdopterin-dependent oxidoreductase YjgC